MKEKCQYLPWKVKPFLENSQGLLLCIGECDSAHCDKMIIIENMGFEWFLF